MRLFGIGKPPEEAGAQTEDIPGEVEKELLQGGKQIGEDEIREAEAILQKYKQGKANLERRIVDDEQWYKMRHWESMRKSSAETVNPSSGWLFNTINNKHADAMDNFPEAVVLPRERSDSESAETLKQILPVVMEYNDFARTYRAAWWEKLKHGTAVYGVFWDSNKDNGLGDIAIRNIDLLNIFWEPGITDIQKSRNLFIVELVDEDVLDSLYPEFKGRMGGGSSVDVAQYIYDDTVDVSNKAVVVDWYYKTRSVTGGTVVQYCKFVGDCLLYASENEDEYRDSGYYHHGKYPVVFDTLYPEKGTPVGFGEVSVCKDAQQYIDRLSANILESSLMATKRRYWVSTTTGVNEDEFLDWSSPLVHVEGELGEERIREITNDQLSSIYVNVLQLKVDEMKDTSANRDVNSGATSSGVTAASAISALQEAGNKQSRDMISASYDAFTDLTELCIELMRQFYDETRSFRITGDVPGRYEFTDFSNAAIRDQAIGYDSQGYALFRKPIFDIKVSAQKKNPFSRAEQNERAKELYSMGFFSPENAVPALGALEMMDFEGKDKVREYINNGREMLAYQQMQNAALLGVNGMQPDVPGGSIGARMAEAQEPHLSYADRLARRAVPNMEAQNG